MLADYYLGKKDCPETKIVVLSDPHVMAPELLASEGYAWTEYMDSQRKMVDYSQALFDEMVAKLKDEIRPDLVMITGSLISYPCDYREVTLSGDLMELSLTTGHISSLTGDDTFSSELAREHLHNSVKKAVRERIEAKVGDATKLMAAVIESMASLVADAFIVHAEGNEAYVDTGAIISGLTLAFIMEKETEEMCRSMLEDKAPYGIAGRENVTDDLILSIADRLDIHEIVKRIFEDK